MTHRLSSADRSIFSSEFSKLCYIRKYTYRLDFDTQFLICLNFLEPLVIVLINMVTILMISAKISTPGLLKIRVFWNNDYDVIISFDDVTKNFTTWFKLCYRCGHVTKVWYLQHFYEKSYHNLNFIRIWPEKPLFLRGGLGSSLIIWDWH